MARANSPNYKKWQQQFADKIRVDERVVNNKQRFYIDLFIDIMA